MQFRYILALGVIALFFVFSQASTDVKPQTVEVVDRANPAVKVVAKILGGLFASAAGSCLMKAAEQCKSHWRQPKEALKCGRNYLKANKGRCAF